MNTRIQVEHPVTEMVTGIDLVVEQFRVAAGEKLSFGSTFADGRAAIEFRINAEDAAQGFRPSPGTLKRWRPPDGRDIRVDSHAYENYAVPPYYDSMLAKLIVSGPDRAFCIDVAKSALARFKVAGLTTTVPFHAQLVQQPEFARAEIHTRWVEDKFQDGGAVMGKRTIQLVDVTLRDAHQCLWATRMTTAMMAELAPRLDRAGFEAIDLVGGAVFDVCVRYLREDPWERMRILSGWVTETPLIVMTRGQSLFTFEFFPDDIVELTAERIFANGIRYHTPYDALNDMRNMEVPVRAAKKVGLYTAGGVVYTLSPVHTDDVLRAQDARTCAARRRCGVYQGSERAVDARAGENSDPRHQDGLRRAAVASAFPLPHRSCALYRLPRRGTRRRRHPYRDFDPRQRRFSSRH